MKRADRMIRINCFRHLSALSLKQKSKVIFASNLLAFRKETRLFLQNEYTNREANAEKPKKALDRFV